PLAARAPSSAPPLPLPEPARSPLPASALSLLGEQKWPRFRAWSEDGYSSNRLSETGVPDERSQRLVAALYEALGHA
ncbi:MAG TPA: hypothetical protein VLQ93_06150, partial [Myxococcaceae bacterium]|nr:hypothetical protein [Myxococcaceae bacterium]